MNKKDQGRKGERMKHDGNDLLRRQACIEAIEGITCSMSLCVNADECHGMQRMRKQAVIELANMPAVQPDHNADVSKKVEQTAEIAQNVQNEDLIQRKAAIDAVNDLSYPSSLVDVKRILVDLPAVQPEIVRCKDCKYYVKDHGWNRIEYMVCGISTLYKVLRNPDDYCSRAERRTDG